MVLMQELHMTSKDEQKISVKVPFQGLYNSIHDAMIDTAMENINQNHQGDYADVIDVTNVRWSEVHLSYSQVWMTEAAKQSGINMVFDSKISPKDYALGNDELIALIPRKYLHEAHKNMEESQRINWYSKVSEALTERPGFIPFSQYPKDAAEWGDVIAWDDAQRDLFFNFIAEPLIDEHLAAEVASESLDDLIWKAVIDPDKVPGHVDNSTELSSDVGL